jgi:hypothetical protein
MLENVKFLISSTIIILLIIVEEISKIKPGTKTDDNKLYFLQK